MDVATSHLHRWCDRWRHCAWGVLLVVGVVGQADSAQVAASEPVVAVEPMVHTLPMHTSNIPDPLRPLRTMTINDRTKWRAAVAMLADPLDTRLGRSFDIQVSTLIRSFQFEGYVLQGHALPWQVGAKTTPDDATRDLHRRFPGVLVFRRDDWREFDPERITVSYFVMFIVGESPVFGVQRVAFCRAAALARALNAGGVKPQEVIGIDRDERGCGAKRMSPPPLPQTPARTPLHLASVPVLGPMFSGSLTSLADVARRGGFRLDLMSPSATVTSNAQISKLIRGGYLHYRAFASWQQDEQLDYFFQYLFQVHHICPGDVVLLAEESSFGQGAIDDPVDQTRQMHAACRRAMQPRRMQFSQNIAAIRAEHAQLDARHEGDVDLSLTPKRYLELDMKDVEASADLPPVYQPQLTSRSDDLALQQLMDTLATYVKPKAVMIVATDVRDRLFMLEVVRRAIPAALPAVLEGDHLLAHPDYRRANRGTLMLRNGPMVLCFGHFAGAPGWQQRCRAPDRSRPEEQPLERRYFSFPTDYAANLFVATRALLLGEHERTTRRGDTPLSVVTLAGTQDVTMPVPPPSRTHSQFEIAADKRAAGGGGSLIAADLRFLAFKTLIPLGLVASALMLLSSAWLWFSSRPGRAILPLLPHALRETGWWLGLRMRQNVKTKEPLSKRTSQSDRSDRSAEQLAATLLPLALVVFLALGWLWLQTLAAAGLFDFEGPSGSLRRVLQLVHGRDVPLLLILFGGYLWFVLLVIARVHAWNQRCHQHWNHGQGHKWRNPHAQRDYHVIALGLALLMAIPPFLGWSVRTPQTVDHTGLTAWFAFLIMVVCLYLLVQAKLQADRLFQLARDVQKHVLGTLPVDLVPVGWPSPTHQHEPALSPLTVQFRDRDWYALEAGGDAWPLPPVPYQCNPWTLQYRDDEAEGWRARTIAEMKFGLVCVRSCLWGAFIGPLVVLAMIQVYPFSFEWEQSAIALCVLSLAFIATVMITSWTERAPLIGQMFTQDGTQFSYLETFKALGGRLLVMLAILAATLAPNLNDSMQGLLGMLRV